MTPAAVVTAVRDALVDVPVAADLILAVSGGADSTGMAHVVVAARPDLRARVVHVRHGLRPDAADVAAARRCAEALNLPFEAVAVSVVDAGDGPEAAARAARMQALTAAAGRHSAAFVALGHTADDQAETVLLNIARGSGLAGLAGMAHRRRLAEGVEIIRPLLAVRRQTVRLVAEAAGLPIAHDPTNTDPQQRRSRARHRVLPLLAELTGGGSDPVEALARLADHARADNAVLDELAAAEVRRNVRRWGPAVMLDVDLLRQLAPPLTARVVRGLVALAAPGPPPSATTVASLLALGEGQGATLAGGLTASCGGGRLAIAAAGVALPERRLDQAVDLPELGLALRRGPEAGPATLPPWAPASAAAGVPVGATDRLVVRARRPGDRIETAAGTQTVADAMIDAGVPRVARDLVPIVEDEAGLLWVPGVAVRVEAAGPWRLRLAPLPGK